MTLRYDNKMYLDLKLASLLALLFSFGCKTYTPTTAFIYAEAKSIDYSQLAHWAAHPDKLDPSDRVPGSDDVATYDSTDVDVFFIHPTTYTGKKGHDRWNADINDQKLNDRTDGSTILYQASIFNQVGRVYAPRYRQAHLYAYRSDDQESSQAAFKKAYADVEAAFLYYMAHKNEGRPFIIASHSQGTTHSAPLIQKHIDGTALQGQLVAAYLVGMPVPKDYFKHLKPCENERDIHCFMAWRAYRRGTLPDAWTGDQYLATNPLNWSIDGDYAEESLNQGSIFRNFNKIYKGRVNAEAHDGFIWTNRPKFAWSFLFTRKNYHIIDYNLFYFNVQKNAALRTREFLGSSQ